ncbi:MAG: DUF1003 domain-containing protein [Bacteroidales bacterium]|nr:DUF1003 domain-containing protein [Bacteroidales bacterium]
MSTSKKAKIFRSDLSNSEFPIEERVSGKTIRSSIFKLIEKDNPEFTTDKFLAMSELNNYRQKYVEEFLTNQLGSLSDLDHTVLFSLKDKNTLSDKLDNDEGESMTFGQRIADKVASFGGSWTFIISFTVFLLLWIMLNIVFLANKGFDPYPFILLNLILSSLAAVQAPVIMMSQNRQEEKDRERGKKDYMINLKSELEIRMLHEKIDHLIISQQQEVIEIHKVQIEMLNDILKRIEK